MNDSNAIKTARPHGLRARLALWAALAVVVLHTGAIALWVAPDTLLRHELGPTRLADYIEPVWDQAWSVFTPQTDFATDQLEMRALLGAPDGKQTTTQWFPITAKEVVASVRYHPFPSRTVLISTRLAASVQDSYDELSPAQRKVFLQASHDVNDGRLLELLRHAATSVQESDAAAIFARTEAATERFVCGLADSRWGSQIVGVQYRKNRLSVPTYGSGGPRQVQSGYSLYSNWRPVPALSKAEKSAYRAYVAEFGIGSQ